MSRDTGGPVFPVLERSYEDRRDGGTLYETTPGMTLRDYFAAKALPAIIAAYIEANGRCIGTEHFPRNVPTLAYQMADAMITERSKS